MMDRQLVKRTTSEAEFFFALLRVTTAQILRAAGIDRCAPSVLDTMADIMRRHMLLLANHCRERAEMSGRSKIELADLAESMQDLGLVHPYTTIDNSSGWEMIEIEDELKVLELEKNRIGDEMRHLKEKEIELKREHSRDVQKTKDKFAMNKMNGSNKSSSSSSSTMDSATQDRLRKQITEINSYKSKIQALDQELKTVAKKADYTTFKLEQIERDPSVAGFLKFVDWAKGEAASIERFVAHAPLTAAQQAAAAAASQAANKNDMKNSDSRTKLENVKTEDMHSKTSNSQIKYQTSPSKRHGSQPPPSAQVSSSQAAPVPNSNSSSDQKEQQSANAVSSKALPTSGLQHPYSEEWLYTLMKKQARVGHENRFMQTVLSPAPGGQLTVGTPESYGFLKTGDDKKNKSEQSFLNNANNTKDGSSQQETLSKKRRASEDPFSSSNDTASSTGNKKQEETNSYNTKHSATTSVPNYKMSKIGHNRSNSEDPRELAHTFGGKKENNNSNNTDDAGSGGLDENLYKDSSKGGGLENEAMLVIQGGPPTLDAQVDATFVKHKIAL